MATEPFNIFSRRIDVRGVIVILRKSVSEIELSGPEDDWRKLTAWTPRRLFRKRSRLLIVHDPEYYDGPGWPAQIFGMQNYIGKFPEVPRKQDILSLIGSFRFALAFPESDFDIRGSDERVKWIYALCGHLDGVIFTPSQLLDANGRVLISCDGRSDATAVLPAIHQVTVEPVAIGSDTLDERVPEPPPANRVAKRAMVLVAVANRGFVEHQRLTIDRPDEIRIAMLKWIDAIDANDEIEPDEWKVLQRPVGSLDERATINAVWRFEGLAVLLWAMQRYELPPYDQLAVPDDLFQATGHFDVAAAREIMGAAHLRSREDLQAYQTHAPWFIGVCATIACGRVRWISLRSRRTVGSDSLTSPHSRFRKTIWRSAGFESTRRIADSFRPAKAARWSDIKQSTGFSATTQSIRKPIRVPKDPSSPSKWPRRTETVETAAVRIAVVRGGYQTMCHDAASTVSSRPIAFVTATSVERRGLPRGDSARYRLSRSIPAALATFAIPPRASAIRRSATRRTVGSSVSSSAALRYSVAKSGSGAVERSSRYRAKCWSSVSRFRPPLLVIVPIVDRTLDVGRLPALVAAAKQQHTNLADYREVNAVARSLIDPQFRDALAQPFAVAEVARSHSVNSHGNLRRCPFIAKAGQPFAEHVRAVGSDIMKDF